jgi:hypothetical protein
VKIACATALTVMASSAWLGLHTGNAPGRNVASIFSGWGKANQIWTDWYRKPMLLAIGELYEMRLHLEHNNLFNTYEGDRYPASVQCDPKERNFRTADGTCTDLVHPAAGAAGIRFGRNVPLHSTYPDDSKILSPDPRMISRVLLTRKDGVMAPVSFLNLWAAAWIQFMTHDWFNHGDNRPNSDSPFELTLAQDDPLFSLGKILVPRTRLDPSRTAGENATAPTYVNINTHWWDGSQLYGSDRATQDRLRSHVDGRLTMTEGDRIPLESDGKEDTGFNQNWWVGLSMLHHVFVREHNHIAAMLKKKNPSWDDERIFQTARLINAAVMAKIHTVEWTPGILKNSTLSEAMHANWYGLVNPTTKVHPFFKLPFVKDPQFNGIVGAKEDNHGVPYSLTEEFVSVYRLHSLLPDEIDFLSLSGQSLGSVGLADTREEKAHAVIDRYNGIPSVAYTFGKRHPGALTLHNFPKTLQNLEMPLVGTMDMGAVDIIRDRERGVPRYNEFRRLINLKPISSFSDLTPDKAQVEELEKIYGTGPEGVEKLDLLIGSLAETVRPNGFGFGETVFQIFILMASRRLEADRFYTSDFRPEVYTQAGLDWIDQAGFKTVLMRNIPEIADKIKSIPNADIFGPW